MSAGWPPAPEPLPLPVVDDHCHLDIPAATRDEAAQERTLDEALDIAARVNVPRAVQVGYDVASSRWSVEAAATHTSASSPARFGGAMNSQGVETLPGAISVFGE